MKKNKPLIKLNNAGVYRDEKWLVKGVSLEINKKEIVTLIGPNGSGKTTTGKLILDILQPDEGSVSLNTKQISYVPQKINIDWAIPLRVIDFMNITSKLNKSKCMSKHNKIHSFLFSIFHTFGVLGFWGHIVVRTHIFEILEFLEAYNIIPIFCYKILNFEVQL